MASITINIEGQSSDFVALLIAHYLADHTDDFCALVADTFAVQPRGDSEFFQPEEVHSVIGGRDNPNHEITYTF